VEDLGTAIVELNGDGTFVFAEEDRSEAIPGTDTIENGIATFNARSTVVYRVTVQGDYLMFARVGVLEQHPDDVVLGTWHRKTDAPVVKPALAGKGSYSVHEGLLTLVDDEGGVSQFFVERHPDGVLLKPLKPGAIPEEPEPEIQPTSTNLLSAVESQQTRIYEELVRAEMRNQLYVNIDGQRYRLDEAYRKVMELDPTSAMGRAARRRLDKLQLSYGSAMPAPETETSEPEAPKAD
jgi:hypothetical protein